MIRDLKGTIEREEAQVGLFDTLEEPSLKMGLEVTTAGFYISSIDGLSLLILRLPAGRAHSLQEGRGATGDVRMT